MPVFGTAPLVSTLVGTGGLSISSNDRTITLSAHNVLASAFEPIAFVTGTSLTSQAPASWWFNRVVLPVPVAVGYINVFKSHNPTAPTATSANSSGTNFYSYTHGISIFKRMGWDTASSQLTLVTTASIGISFRHTFSSSSQSFAASWVTDSTGGTSSFSTTSSNSSWANFVTGVKLWRMPLVTTLSAGEYFFAHNHSTTRASTGQSGLIFNVSNIILTAQLQSAVGTLGGSGSFAFSNRLGMGEGIASAVTTNTTMAGSVVSANTQQFMYFNLSYI